MKLICRYIILFAVFSITDAHARIKYIGVPGIVNHSRNQYNASTQNWSITQNEKGFIYIGNNDGVLEYDGTNWKTYPVPNLSIVRSVYASDDTIYTGAFEEIGFLAPDEQGQLIYHSLKQLIPSGYTSFDEVWNIFSSGEKIVFQSFKYIFILKSGEISVIEPLSEFSMLHQVNGRFYVVDNETGLMMLKDDSLLFLSNHPIFFRNEIRCILPMDNGNLLIGTSNEGMYLYNEINNRIISWDTDVNQRINANKLFSAVKLSDGSLALGTVSNGIYLSDQSGRVLQHLNRYKGLQNNTVLSLFEDGRNNLWLGLDNGIDYLEISSPLTYLNYNYNIESAYTSIIFNDILYVGTNQGLYAREFSGINNFDPDNPEFQLVRGTEGQVWKLEVIDNTLFCGHNFGCFIIEGFSSKQITDIRGIWSFIRPVDREDLILAGTYSGLARLKKINNRWIFFDEIKGFNESSRNIYLDPMDHLWISHGYKGLFKLSLSTELDSVSEVKLFIAESGLPELLPYNIQLVNSEMIVTTHSGILRYNYAKSVFEKHDVLNKIFNGKDFIDKIHQDKNGNIWYFTDEYMGLMRLLEDGNYIDIISPFSIANEVLMPAFQNIFIYNPYNVFIGSQKGLIHYSPNIIKDYLISEEVYIKEATFTGKNKEQISYFLGNIVNITVEEARILPFTHNSVTFRYTCPAFESPDKIRFSYRLVGFDMNWSDWDGVNFKEYTNLREGNYTFQVNALNAFNAESEIRSFHFIVQPPFVRSGIAYFIYGILLILVIAGNFYYIRKRILKTRMKEKLKHEKRLAIREQMFKEQTALSEKEIIQLRNESLLNEMKFKNKELANAALHLLQKNKTLTYIKDDLGKLHKEIPPNSSERERVNSLLKKINKDLRNEKSWELFNSYFDEVHQDFIARLKDRFRNLSPKELRLCAYLRMNISTKEIAPLMNISVRGVEISRYRLRKKLRLGHNVNLTDFLMNF